MPEDLRAYYNQKDAFVCRENPDLAPLRDAGIIEELKQGFQELAPLYRFLQKVSESIEVEPEEPAGERWKSF